ncbi:MAG: aminopeptidase, partial [Hymenobacter sp.]
MHFTSFRPWLVPVAASLLLASCQGQSTTATETAAGGQPTEAAPTDTASVPTPNDGITPALLAQHIKVLASDEFQGRRPFTVGEEKATTYLANEFKKLGLQP